MAEGFISYKPKGEFEKFDWPEIGYGAKLRLNENEIIEAEIYECRYGEKPMADGTFAKTVYYSEFGGELTEDFSKSDYLAKGTFVPNGSQCSNWWTGIRNFGFHFCDKDSAVNLGVAVGRVYDIVFADYCDEEQSE